MSAPRWLTFWLNILVAKKRETNRWLKFWLNNLVAKKNGGQSFCETFYGTVICHELNGMQHALTIILLARTTPSGVLAQGLSSLP